MRVKLVRHGLACAYGFLLGSTKIPLRSANSVLVTLFTLTTTTTTTTTAVVVAGTVDLKINSKAAYVLLFV